MKVLNINGTSENKCFCNSWLNHWEKFSGKKANYCSVRTCLEMTDLVGAHIQKDSLLDKNWYIIPLCNEHNQKSTSLDISDNISLISANISQTCGKK